MSNKYNVRIKVKSKDAEFLSIVAGGNSLDWRYLLGMPDNGDTLDLSGNPFELDDLIPDQARYRWNGTDLDRIDPPVSIAPGAIVIILESPHAKEYQKPRGPLKDDGNVRNQLPRLLKDMGVPAGRQVGFCNPVRFQTSLYHFMTSKLRKYVDQVLPWLCCPLVTATEHPSVWNKYTKLSLDPAGLAWGWLAKHQLELVRAVGWLRLESPTLGVELVHKATSALWSQSVQEWRKLAAEVAQHMKSAGASVPSPQWKQP